MPDPDAVVIEEINSALGSELEITIEANGSVQVTEAGTRRRWTVVGSKQSIAAQAANRTLSGVEAGTGGGAGSEAVSPGAALLAIHIGEAVATAGPDASRLVVHSGRVDAE